MGPRLKNTFARSEVRASGCGSKISTSSCRMEFLGALAARPRPLVEGCTRAAWAGGMLAGSGAVLFLRSTDEVGGRAVGPAGLYLLYPRCVRVSSGDVGAAGACAFLLDFFEDLHFRRDLEEDGADGGTSSSPTAPAPVPSCSRRGADGAGGGGVT